MSEELKREVDYLQQKKSELLIKLGQSIYYQYRVGLFVSEELKDFGDQISQLDVRIHQLNNEIFGEGAGEITRCICGHLVDEEDAFCSNCGREIERGEMLHQVTCEDCGSEVISQAKFCHVCGSRQSVKQGVSR